MRVLLVCLDYTVYLYQIWNEITKRYRDVEFSLLIYDDGGKKARDRLAFRGKGQIYEIITSNNKRDNIFLRVYKRYRNVFRAIYHLPQFDIIHFMWIYPRIGLFAGMIRSKTDKMFLSVGGSDLYRESSNLLYFILQKRLIKRADYLSAENTETVTHFFEVYGQKYRRLPMVVNNYGVDLFDNVDKFKTNVRISDSKDKVVIACGHNANYAHQHQAMIEHIVKLPEKIRNSCKLVFPMTYGEQESGYIDEMEELLKNYNLDYEILRDYMNNDQMAEYISRCDIMIHIQKTDQLSSTMLTHMYCGNVVIAGSWLPYQSLWDAGIFFVNIDSIEQLEDALSDVISNIGYYKEKCKGNKDVVYELASWDVAAKRWYDSYKRITQAE